MFRYIPIVFLFGFFVELASLIWIGSLIGVLQTLFLVLLGAVVGVGLIRRSGLSMVNAMRDAGIRGGKPPASQPGAAFLLLLSGILFLVPGFVSDVMGLLLLFPPIRTWLGAKLVSPLQWELYGGKAQSPASGVIIEGEAIEIQGEIVEGHEGERR